MPLSCSRPLPRPSHPLSLLGLAEKKEKGRRKKKKEIASRASSLPPRTTRALATKLLCFGKLDHGFCCCCACSSSSLSALPQPQLSPSGSGPLFVFPRYPCGNQSLAGDATQSLGKGDGPECAEFSIPFCRGSRPSSVCTCMDVRSSRLGSAEASGLQTCPGGWAAHSAHQGLVSRRVNKSIGWALSPRQPQLLPNLSAAQSVCIC